MKKTLIITAAISLIFIAATTKYQESIYSHTVKTIEGVNKPLSAHQGKKILIITLPTQQNASNDSLLKSIDSLRIVHGTSLQIIAVPSFEDGYTGALKASLKTWYRSKLNMAIIVTEGMYTRKTSGVQQHALFKWLTDKNKNGHMDKDVTGARCKFLIWTDGELTGVLGSNTKMNGVAMRGLFE
jgi:glutathione peroxidase